MWKWLEWDGWDGVAGVVSLLALIAALIAVIDLALTWRLHTRRDLAIDLVRKTADGNEYEMTVRPIGPATMYEVEFIEFGFDARVPFFLVSVLTSRDKPLRVTFTAVPGPGRQLSDCWVGIQWVDVTRLGTRARSSRVQILGPGFQCWKPYRWTWWPRKARGRWRDIRQREVRGALH